MDANEIDLDPSAQALLRVDLSHHVFDEVRLQNGLLEADYIVVEMARQILGEHWLPDYVREANQGGIERVLV